MTHQAAVLTGDLIASTQAGQAATDAAMALIESVASAEAPLTSAEVRFDRFRGDGWQVYCGDPAKVLRLTVLILAKLHARPDLPQTRIAAAIGNATDLPHTGLSSANGEAFSISGRVLDGMTTQRLLFQNARSTPVWQTALFTYLDWQSSRWSPEQAEAIALAFRHDPARPGSVATDLGVSRQAAQSRLKGAGFWPLYEAIAAFDTIPASSP